jgi:hypothetical protein
MSYVITRDMTYIMYAPWVLTLCRRLAISLLGSLLWPCLVWDSLSRYHVSSCLYIFYIIWALNPSSPSGLPLLDRCASHGDTGNYFKKDGDVNGIGKYYQILTWTVELLYSDSLVKHLNWWFLTWTGPPGWTFGCTQQTIGVRLTCAHTACMDDWSH